MYILDERFWSKVNKTDTCWLWVSTTNAYGYGQFSDKKDSLQAHRLAYAWAKGAIPQGLRVGQTCLVRNCVNPDHLRLVTIKQAAENRLGLNSTNTSGYRGVSWHARNSRWYVRVKHKGVTYCGGYHKDVHTAGEEARLLRLKLHTHNELDKN